MEVRVETAILLICRAAKQVGEGCTEVIAVKKRISRSLAPGYRSALAVTIVMTCDFAVPVYKSRIGFYREDFRKMLQNLHLALNKRAVYGIVCAKKLYISAVAKRQAAVPVSGHSEI